MGPSQLLGLIAGLLFALLPFTAFVLLVVSIVRDIAGKKSLRATIVIAAVSASLFYVWDAFGGFILVPHEALLLSAGVVLYFLPATLWALPTDRRGRSRS
jgi:hypothetical protein